MTRFLLLLVLAFFLLLPQVNSAGALEGVVRFSGNKKAVVSLEVAYTTEEKLKGLMNRPSLPWNHGMVFVFRPAQQVTFWMKDTLFPLDLIFVNGGKIVKIVKDAKPNQTETLYPSDLVITEVIEVNSGYAASNMINVDSKVFFENISQIDYSGKSKLMITAR